MITQGIGWGDFVAARSRFLANLERDAETRRLEIAWTLQSPVAAADAEGRPVIPGDVESDGAAARVNPDAPGNGRLEPKTGASGIEVGELTP
jgi:hypothetical protein